jgi:hypothetical protein
MLCGDVHPSAQNQDLKKIGGSLRKSAAASLGGDAPDGRSALVRRVAANIRCGRRVLELSALFWRQYPRIVPVPASELLDACVQGVTRAAVIAKGATSHEHTTKFSTTVLVLQSSLFCR